MFHYAIDSDEVDYNDLLEVNMDTFEKGNLYSIPLSDLNPDPDQPRKYMDPQALEELTASIKQHGVLVPILFRKGNDGKLYIVAGERRVQAAKKLGLEFVPGIFVEGSSAEISIVENLLRQDLTAIEEAEALKRLMDEQSYTQEQLSNIIGKARSTISEILTLNRLPEEIKDECRSNPAISRAVLLEIARKKQKRAMLSAWKKYKERLAKEAQGRKRQKRVENGTEVIKWINTVNDRIQNIDPSQWTEEERESYYNALNSLKSTLLNILSPSSLS